MAITIDNRLHGPDGDTPSNSSLASSGRVGTVEVESATDFGYAEYDNAETVHGFNSIRVETGHSRNVTARLTFELPPAPWYLRFYVRLPTTQDVGESWEEGIWVARVGDHGLVLHETAGGNIGFRLQPEGLWEEPIEATLDGTAFSLDQLLRIELHSDGTDTVCRAYAQHDESTPRIATWSGVAPSGTAGELTAYRYTRNRHLAPGDNDPNEEWTGDYPTGSTPVADLQNALMDLGYDLPEFGADGWYGQELINAVAAFQQDYGYDLVDGEAGQETLAGIRLATWTEVDGTGRPPPVWLSHLAASDSDWVGPADEFQESTVSVSTTVTATTGVDAYSVEGPRQGADAGAAVTAWSVPASKNAHTSASGVITASGDLVPASRAVSAARAVGTAAVPGSGEAAKHSDTSASGEAFGSSSSSGSKHSDTTASVSARAFTSARSSGARAAISLNYMRGHVSAPFEPTEDDQQLVNDVTAKRTDGSEFRVTKEEGPNSVQDPPVGVGRYEESIDLNAAHDIQLRNHAGWRLHLGTYDDARYPTVTVNLARNPDLIANVTSRESGDWLQITSLPEWLPPEPIELLIEGYEERLNVHTWEVTFNASSGGPWTVGVIEDPENEDDNGPRQPNRADTEECVLVSAIGEMDTTFDVETLVGPSWVDTAEYPDQFPFDVKLGGEIVRVTSVDGSGSVQTFTVTRSLNTIIKSHPAGTHVSLARPAIVGL